ncbi:MAG: methyltransferase domain-containing protein [Woeseiaceae bacterium]|nr:methyltransferase domain-containing protein [Woeseiaceae bacterium]
MAAAQQHRFRGAIFPTASHPAIRRAKRNNEAPEIHGNKLWKSSCLIIDYLHRNPEPRPRRVLDAGCGWGIGGIWCARHFGAAVTSVDADRNVFPFLEVTAELNGVRTEPRVCRFERLGKRDLSAFDTLIAADVCFWDELVGPVANLVNRAVDAGVERIIIADPERPTFHTMAERCLARHGGELINWRTRGALAASGALLVIDNR